MIEQRGLADVRASNDSDEWKNLFFAQGLFLLRILLRFLLRNLERRG
jgi:hypothetical protein